MKLREITKLCIIKQGTRQLSLLDRQKNWQREFVGSIWSLATHNHSGEHDRIRINSKLAKGYRTYGKKAAKGIKLDNSTCETKEKL